MLSREEILKLLKGNPPLIEGMVDLANQVQPNGIDLTLKDIASYATPGTMSETNGGRILSVTNLMPFETDGGITLPPGCYLITHNEVVNLPNNLMALARPRSSLLRCGVAVHTAVWDAGYSGRSQSLLVVYNQFGFRLYRNARVIQMVFFYLNRAVNKGYKGMFQGENITPV
ncbi:MAG TPA: deoxyuridine 5'-triphosphate nucleotidohydrolase [Dehalococcoidia bacterium]|nr:deoxyuridine 5'-triphosphate nucleotidohydrolase [Dehalococcoidia bacterium]